MGRTKSGRLTGAAGASQKRDETEYVRSVSRPIYPTDSLCRDIFDALGEEKYDSWLETAPENNKLFDECVEAKHAELFPPAGLDEDTKERRDIRSIGLGA